MPLSVNHPEADQLAHALARRMGESVDEAVVKALRERLARTPDRAGAVARRGELVAIGRECAALPDYDMRRADEILGYDEHGVPAEPNVWPEMLGGPMGKAGTQRDLISAIVAAMRWQK
ncbi:MAG: type II toxin-antitoxin system VapB family antitoxin [Bryobacterales bacterium]|nr:type II toxin-antitoxin system VapB family antitoxin [Bryobacterales bacterium]